MNAIIIEDERKARQLLAAMIAEHCPEVNVVAECEDLPSGVKAIKRESPDVIFLDIEMPGHSGLELLDFFNDNEINFDLIFTTAYSEYAIKAFKMSAIDYLLKPIQPDELIGAVKRLKTKKELLEAVKLLRYNLSNSRSKKIVLNQNKGIEFLETDDITFLKANGAYTEIHKNDGSYTLASKNLKHFEDLLCTEPNFFRTQKSFIVNTKYVETIQKTDGNFVLNFGTNQVLVSQDRVEELISLIKG